MTKNKEELTMEWFEKNLTFDNCHSLYVEWVKKYGSNEDNTGVFIEMLRQSHEQKMKEERKYIQLKLKHFYKDYMTELSDSKKLGLMIELRDFINSLTTEQ